jgi:hypothetical protein
MDYSPEFEPESYNDTPGSRKYEEIEISSFHKHKAKEGSCNLYQTLLGEGRIYAQDISREDGPYYSEIATALYKARAPIETLRHVYFDNVVNIDTIRFVRNRLYTAENGLNWPPDRSVMVWEYGTAEYQGLLGTRLGKVVAYIVLGAFPRGTRYISKVSSFAGADYDYALHLRFDIEMIPVGLARGG